ncbi:MAG: hypothetical protein HQL14_01245 [Candidatus Omnitrophica bacterium]|nr:hypothetical protein [Candidatus Omnitrophota bacterium]
MGIPFAWPVLRLVQRLSMVLTLGLCAYVAYSMFISQGNSMLPESIDVPIKAAEFIQPAPELDLKPYDAAVWAQNRDIFSSPTAIGPSGNVEITPKGQLPAHLKIVGILIAGTSEVIIEDTLAHMTYFIDQGKPQAGIRIVRVNKNQLIINYQGQDIPLAIHKGSNDKGG